MLDLQRIGSVTSQAFLLFLLASYPTLPATQLAAIIRLLVTFFVRRSVTDTPPTRDLDKLFIELIDWCRQLDHIPTAADVRAFLRQPVWYVTDEPTTLPEAKLQNLLVYSGVGIAMKQLRSRVADLTSFAPFGKYMLPTLDMDELLKQKREKPTVRQSVRKNSGVRLRKSLEMTESRSLPSQHRYVISADTQASVLL